MLYHVVVYLNFVYCNEALYKILFLCNHDAMDLSRDLFSCVTSNLHDSNEKFILETDQP